MEKVLLVTEIQSFKQLLHQTANVALAEHNAARINETDEVVIHVLEHQIERTCSNVINHTAHQTRYLLTLNCARVGRASHSSSTT